MTMMNGKWIAVPSAAIVLSSIISGCATAKQPSPKDVAQKFVDGIHAANEKEVLAEASDPKSKDFKFDTKSTSGKFIIDMLKQDQFSVGSEKIKGNSASVNVKVTTPDMGDVFDKAIKDSVSYAMTGASNAKIQSHLYKDLDQYVKSDKSTKTSNVKLNMVKMNSGWKVSTKNSAFMSAVIGHIDQMLKDSQSSSSASQSTSK